MSTPITNTQEYKQLTKVLEILELQREQVIKDKEFIENAYKEAIQNPIEYIESLVSGAIRLPPKLNIINVPDLTTLPTYNHLNNNNNNNKVKRQIDINNSGNSEFNISYSVNSNNNNSNGGSGSGSGSVGKRSHYQSDTEKSDSCFEESESDKKPPKPFKPHSKTNLAYWTEEEQAKLEKLLVEFPEEDFEVATHRWTKIANALGNRTVAQVSSRTQKYFKKLERMGREIPGSRPKKKRSGSISNSNSNSNISSYNKNIESSSDERVEKRQKSSSSSSSHSSTIAATISSHNNNSSSGGSNTTNNNNNNNNRNNSFSSNNKPKHQQQKVHEGYKCDGCDIEPIVGIRWHCEECMDEVDLCSKCHDELEEIGKHLSSHHMTAFQNPDSYFLDDDYKYTYPTGESNYLDPNYR